MDCSVIIPSRNRRHVLARCLACLRDQDLDHDRFEIVVVDDGSTDGTLEIARAFAGERVTIRGVRCPQRRGPAAARNRGLEVARGNIAIFVDDDALAPPWFLREHMRSHRGSDPTLVDGPAITISGANGLARPRFTSASARLLAGLGFFGRAFATVNASAPAGALRRCGGFDESLIAWEDVDLGRRLRAMGLKRHRNRRAYVLHWKDDAVTPEERLLLAEERGRYAGVYYRRYGDRTARWQARLRYLQFDAALVRLGLAGRSNARRTSGGDPHAAAGHGRTPIMACELIHAYARGLRSAFRQNP